MRRLILLRHAKTETTAPSGRDFDRRLDPRGEADAAMIGQWMASDAPRADRALVSPAARANQTWEIVAKAFGPAAPAMTLVKDIYNAEITDLLGVIRAGGVEHKATSLIVVGHNPGLHELALLLIGNSDARARSELAENLPTGALVVIDFPASSWDEIGFRSGTLKLFISPKLLKA